MSEDEQTTDDGATGAEEHHLEEAEDPGEDGSAADEDERSPWAE